MAQKSAKLSGNKRKQSAGSVKKKRNKVNKVIAKKSCKVKDRLASAFMNKIETSMAVRVPSDQRDKLTVLKQAPNPDACGAMSKMTDAISAPGRGNKIIKKKKRPLTKGRRRK